MKATFETIVQRIIAIIRPLKQKRYQPVMATQTRAQLSLVKRRIKTSACWAKKLLFSETHT